MKTVLLLTVVSTVAFAEGWQNMDFNFLFGAAHASALNYSSIPAGTSITTIPTGPATLSGSVGFTDMFGLGYQVASTKAGSLYLEMQQTFVWSSSGVVQNGSTVSNVDRNSWFWTPGVRFKVPTGTRLSFQGALGGGVAYFNEQDTLINGQALVTNASSAHPALDFGGGIDLRISRWFSLRAEARDFVTARGYGGTFGHNHPVFLFGVAFHL